MTLLTDRSERVAEDPGPAAELAPMVEVWFRILADHVPDEDRAAGPARGAPSGVALPGAGVGRGARQWHALGLSARGRRLPGLRGASCPLTLREREFLSSPRTAGVTWRSRNGWRCRSGRCGRPSDASVGPWGRPTGRACSYWHFRAGVVV